MAELLDEFAEFVASAAGLTVGVTLFKGGLPADGQATVSALMPTGGEARGNSPLRASTFQVITRGANLPACLAQANSIYSAMLGATHLPRFEEAMTTLKLKHVEPLQPPADIGKDEASRRRTSFNLRVTATE